MPEEAGGISGDVKKALSDKWVKIGAIAGVGVLVLTVVLFMRGGGGSSTGGAPPAATATDLTGIGSELSQLATGEAQILNMLGGTSGPGSGAPPPVPQMNPVTASAAPVASHWREVGPAVFLPPGSWRPR